MSGKPVRWNFEGGYTDLLHTATLVLLQKKGPAETELKLEPRKLLKGKKCLVFEFSLEKNYSGTIPECFSWSLKPESSIRLRIIPPGEAFLGNFRVPEEHYAVEWRLLPTAAAAVVPGGPGTLTAAAGTKLNHTWIELFPDREPLLASIHNAWNNCVNPFDPEQVSTLTPSQILRWRWTGIFKVGAGISWSLEKGWAVDGDLAGVRYSLPFRTGVTLRNQINFAIGGHFYIQVSRKNGRLKFSLIREKEIEALASASLGIQLRHTPYLKAENDLIDPLIGPAEDAVKDCIGKKIRFMLAGDASKWKRKKCVIRARWDHPLSPDFQLQYASALSGIVPGPGSGCIAEGKFDRIEGKEVSIRINVLNRLCGFRRTRTRFDSVTADPAGDLLLEKGISRTDQKYRWDETEFIRLMFSRLESGGDTYFRWNWETRGNFSRKEMSRILRTILHGRVIPRFVIPGGKAFPLYLRISTSTRFSLEGIEGIKSAPPSRQWNTLLKALELTYPERYVADSFWRDWIDYPEVRHEIIRNPVHCHLPSRYPVEGRTEMQRHQAVQDYRRALRFLEIMDLWQNGRDSTVLLNKCLDFPLFLYFHLLCEPREKTSALSISGDWEFGIIET